MRGERLGGLVDAVMDGGLARRHYGRVFQFSGFFQPQIGVTGSIGGVRDGNGIEYTV